MGDESSGAGPRSVVRTSKTVIHIHTRTHSHTHACTNTHTHTHRVTLVKAVVAGEAAVRPGLELEIRRLGLMAVKAPTTESVLPLILILGCFLILSLSFVLSNSSAKVTQKTSDWLAPVAYCSDRQHSDV